MLGREWREKEQNWVNLPKNTTYLSTRSWVIDENVLQKFSREPGGATGRQLKSVVLLIDADSQSSKRRRLM